MMQLTSVTVIKNLTAKTENGNYQIEHHVVRHSAKSLGNRIFT